ncbi:M15 family metallopeptidase [Caloramator quimbayensis]|uniref:M15 family metallopeptidase n=1 Tax=Caloramator quimbayensis TaxID=1147123 RepID=UPI001FA8D84F|nr:M15 family metallopeptidase [Caloramator quimbayensis]
MTSTEDLNSYAYITEAKRDILCLMMSYPDYIKDIEKNNNCIYIVMNSGEKILYDDKKKKSHDEKILNADIQDMMEQIYPLNTENKIMEKDFDPGRARCYSFFKAVYGNSKLQIEKNLTLVNTPFGSFNFNKNNSAAVNFKNVMIELSDLSLKNQSIRKNILPMSGTFNYRNIAGTNNLSAHSFGIAVDLSVNKNDYWKWTSRQNGEKRLESYPKEIVSIFEKNNFIWGGKWGHFDIMHYEYRPEIIFKSKYFGRKIDDDSAWYGSVPNHHEKIKNYIEMIDKLLY